MLFILYPPGMNWFYESLARNLHQDLVIAGSAAQLVTPLELLRYGAELGSGDDVLIVNLFECSHAIAKDGAALNNGADSMSMLRARLGMFGRRIALNLDSIHTHWFKSQLDAAAGLFTDIFDLGMAPQCEATTLARCTYTWIPECFTLQERRELVPRGGQRNIPWAMIGHQTRERCELTYVLGKHFSSSGVVFLPELRPYGTQGTRNLSPDAMRLVLKNTDFYIWTSHHRFPYHEGLRALQAIQNGAIPAKIDPLFAFRFKQIPWVHESVEALTEKVRCSGLDALFEQAKEFVLSHGTIGERLSAALYGVRPHGSKMKESPEGEAADSKDLVHERLATT